ncbi:hypothetical protein NE237_019333 [Protea cynaroides]|uniref:Uncharacterized protein n=1 Tax=Protea cynaroides TaxID=273540 RepID=A0A9Q0QQ01_9MAGN|nr:hypothetical protein NE237_019333 [Protea cynaroides]
MGGKDGRQPMELGSLNGIEDESTSQQKRPLLSTRILRNYAFKQKLSGWDCKILSAVRIPSSLPLRRLPSTQAHLSFSSKESITANGQNFARRYTFLFCNYKLLLRGQLSDGAILSSKWKPEVSTLTLRSLQRLPRMVCENSYLA